jgi:phosphonoacetaldehyde hydrolase
LPAAPSEVRLVVFDWAGTTVDHGSLAPVGAFVQAFACHGVTLTPAEARGPMGLHKKDHVRALLRLPQVAVRWSAAHRRDWDEADVESLYRALIPIQLEALAAHSGLVPGLTACVEQLRRRGIKIGATTGYFRAAAERVYEAARRQGFVPDHCVCAEDVPEGRPAPWMVFRVMEALRVYPPAAVVKVGDTVPDVEEGLNAGAWSVGVTGSGSEVGCTAEELSALAEPERRAKLEAAARTLRNAGAHAAFSSLAELPALLDDIGGRLRRGEGPPRSPAGRG